MSRSSSTACWCSAKNKTDLLTEWKSRSGAEHQERVILSGIGSVRGYRFHNVTGRDYPVPAHRLFGSAPNIAGDDFIAHERLMS